ncbi:AraC family transcriptional regulator [Alkalihalobacillus sp. MEB130]|uniref:AraC family transcriptional regulator n=1 Tax=Alkalihalobacillus sp. MEB130 TaxID=2976704 RepID=UPI0028DFED10|nr:AraC family transcriptional regulator [Alkalihalobacillus sp. MEB130]MDT8859794.1 AraC family transcriptional regulator [Alkalihalobacillus sp. MEB130]
MKSQSLLTKLIVFASIISIIPVVIVGVFSYVQSSKHIQEKVNHEKVQIIQQVHSNIEQVLMTIHHSITNTIESPLMDDVIRRPLYAEDFSIYRELRQNLSNLRSYDTKVEEVILLNFQENWIVNNSGLSRLSDYEDREAYLSYLNAENDSTWLLLNNQEFSKPMAYGSCENTISLVQKLPARYSEKYGLAFTNIPTCSLADMINVDGLSDEVVITDENYRIIVHRNEELIGTSLVDAGYVSSLDAFTEKSGQFNTDSRDNSYTVTYHKSDFNNWNYISFNSIDMLTAESKKIGWITFFMITFIVITCSLYIWIISKKLYSPVNKLVNYIDGNWPDQDRKKKNELEIIEEHINDLFSSKSNLEIELREHTQQVKSLFIHNLFTGNYKTSEIEEKLEYFQLQSIVNQWRSMVVFTLHIDSLDRSNYESANVEKVAFAVKSLVEDTLNKKDQLQSVWVEETLVTLIGFSEQTPDNIQDTMYDLTETIQSKIKNSLNISVSIGISLPFYELIEAKRGYKEGMEALKHRMKLGKGVIIHFSSINSGKHTVIFDYPKRTEEELLVAVKLADKEKALEQLRIWMEKAFKNTQSPREYQISMMRLLNNLLMLKQEGGVSFQQIEVFHASLYEELLKLQMKEEIEQWFQERLIIPLMKVFSDRRDSQFQNLSEKIIDLIHRNFDSDITLEECAEKLHYNANYLSSVFKQETNYTFSEYLAMYRFKKAKEWLTETNMTVKEIADHLRYKNSQNFIRSFKKQEEMTPGQYREKYKKTS